MDMQQGPPERPEQQPQALTVRIEMAAADMQLLIATLQQALAPWQRVAFIQGHMQRALVEQTQQRQEPQAANALQAVQRQQGGPQ